MAHEMEMIAQQWMTDTMRINYQKKNSRKLQFGANMSLTEEEIIRAIRSIEMLSMIAIPQSVC